MVQVYALLRHFFRIDDPNSLTDDEYYQLRGELFYLMKILGLMEDTDKTIFKHNS